jgi:hypothetical protein
MELPRRGTLLPLAAAVCDPHATRPQFAPTHEALDYQENLIPVHCRSPCRTVKRAGADEMLANSGASPSHVAPDFGAKSATTRSRETTAAVEAMAMWEV